MANSGSGRRSGSGSGNRRPSGTGNRSGTTRRSGAPAKPPGAPGAADTVDSSALTKAAGAEPPEATNGHKASAKGSASGRSSADERARDRLAEQRASGARRAGPTAGRPRPAAAGGTAAKRPASGSRGAKSRNRPQQGRKSSTNAAIFGSIFVVLAVVIIIVIATLGDKSPTSVGGQILTRPASASLAAAVSKIPASSFAAAGKNSPEVSDQDTLLALPSSTPVTTRGGKPFIVYMGAEYCPYCAAFRWPFAIALSRFGKFTGLKETASGVHDVYPNTHTLSFYGATYSSPYISLSTTEFNSNVCKTLVSAGCEVYDTLQIPIKANYRFFTTYDTKKYFPKVAAASQSNSGWIPFVYWAGKYIETGGFYSPAQLQKFTYPNIVAAIKNPSIPDSPGQSILQAANIYTAVICQIDGGKPASVCDSAPVKAAIAALPKPTK